MSRRRPGAGARRAVALLAAAAALAGAPPAAAHEVLHEVVRGRAVAVRATYADGAPLAYVGYEVFSPADPRLPHQKGRTDRSGWLAFVPDTPGAWRVRIADETGHGLDATVQVDAPGAAGGPAPAQQGGAGAAFVLRPLLGLLLVAAIFAGLVAWRRRKGPVR